MPPGSVGREPELRAVAELLDDPAPGATALVVEGEAGIGKTTLVRAALGLAADRDLRVFLARPTAGEKELPHAALGDLLAGVTGDALARLAEPQRVAVEVALGRQGSREIGDHHALGRGVLELLRQEGVDGRLFMVIDDVQWLDRPSASALSFALRRLGGVPVRVLVALRTPPELRSEVVVALEEWGRQLRRLAVGPLPTTALGTVLRGVSGVRLSRPRLEEVARASGGNPMFAIELARQGDGRGVPASVSTLPLALAARLEALDPRTRSVLAIASAALQPSTELARAGIDEAELRLALDTGFVVRDGDGLSFAHPLLASAVYDALFPDERRLAHRRLLASSSNALERGHHVSRSTVRPDESAAAALEEAADAAAGLGDHAGAAAFFLRAAELAPDPAGESATRCLVSAAGALETAGDIGSAEQLARDLVDRLPAGAARANARQTLVSCALGASMSYADGLVQYELALADAHPDSETRALIHLAAAEVCTAMCRLDEGLANLAVARDLADEAGSDDLRVAVLSETGFAECMLGDGVTESALRAFAEWDPAMVCRVGYTPRMALACARLHATEFEEAERLLVDEIRFAEERGLETNEVAARGHLAEVQLRRGHWSLALENARLAVEHARQAANDQVLAGVTYPLAAVEGLLGNHDRARGLSTEALAAAEATGDFWFVVSHRSVLGVVALAEDAPLEAIEILEPAWELMLERRLGDLSIFPVAQVLAESLATVGRFADAAAVVAALRASPISSRPWCRTMTSRCSALAASIQGDHDGARAALEMAIEAQSELPEPFERARTTLVQGRVERNARNWGAARAALVSALEQFDTLGASRWAEKTSAEIARVPGRRPGRSDDLTTREREIATLVAEGLANKEVAARLFLTIRTVEANLSKVYAKLGVRSRTELAVQFSRRDGA